MRARVPTPRESRPSKIEEAKHIPRPYKLRRYYTPKEVAAHNSSGDVWISLFDKVYDLTLLINKNARRPECDPIVLAAGTDVSHWFDIYTQMVRLIFSIAQTTLSRHIQTITPLYYSPRHLSTRILAACITCALWVVSFTCPQQSPTLIGIPTSKALGGKTKSNTS